MGKGYESAHILGKHYHKDNLPTDKELINDLQEMLEIYKDIEALFGSRTYKEFNDELLTNADNLFIEEDEDENYQEASNNQEINNLANNHIPHAQEKKSILTSLDSKTYYPRDPKQATIALELAKHLCEYDPSLPSFVSKNSGKNYIEAHHLIPIKYFKEFNYSIDVPENIIALNPLSHRQIHHGTDQKKEEIIEKLYKDVLKILKKLV